MIQISDSAKNYFRHLLAQQDIDGLGIRMKAVNAGTPKADCVLEYCETSELAGNEARIDCDGFSVFVDAMSVDWLAQAEVDYQVNTTGGQLTIRAPHIKGSVPELVDLPKGCPFAGRCSYTVDACLTTRPPATMLPQDHAVRCIRLEEIAAEGAIAP